MMRLALAVALSSTPLVTAHAKSNQLPPPKERFHLFLLIGQSNMAGRGEIEQQDTVPDPRVLMLDKQGKWLPAIDPMHFDKPIAGVGLGRTFGIEVAKEDQEITVGLVPCAVGGSPIDSWSPGAYDRPTKSHPYDDAVRRTKIAMESGVLKGILWHQGESDAKKPLADQYQAKLDALIQRLRADLNAPNVPFILGQMGRFPGHPWDVPAETINRVHEELPARVPQTGFVSSNGLHHNGDGVHFDSASYRELGRRYARVYQLLLKRTGIKSNEQRKILYPNESD